MYIICEFFALHYELVDKSKELNLWFPLFIFAFDGKFGKIHFKTFQMLMNASVILALIMVLASMVSITFLAIARLDGMVLFVKQVSNLLIQREIFGPKFQN